MNKGIRTKVNRGKIKNIDAGIILKKALKTYNERSKDYGKPYKQHGKIMSLFFPNGLILKTEDDFKRFGMINIIIAKMHRYIKNFNEGKTHIDSLHDMGIYAFLLEEVDREIFHIK